MQISSVYIIISVSVLVILALLLVITKPRHHSNRFSPLASLAFGFVLAGSFFGENRWLGYGLMGVGIAFAIADIIKKTRVNKE